MKKNSNSVISGHRRHVFELHWPIITPPTDYSSPPTGANDFLSPHKTNVMSTVKHYLAVCVCVCVRAHTRAQSRPTFCNPKDCSPPGSSVPGIPRQEYWSGLPFPSPGDLPDPGIEPTYLQSAALAVRFFTMNATGKQYLLKLNMLLLF